MFLLNIFRIKNIILILLILTTLILTAYWFELIPYYLTAQDNTHQLPISTEEANIKNMSLFGIPFLTIAVESDQPITCSAINAKGQITYLQVENSNSPYQKSYQGFHLFANEFNCN